MFLKILKWDLVSQRKIFILFLIYIFSIVMFGLAVLTDLEWLIGISLVMHVLAASTLLIAPIILLAINYYDDFYGKNSYTIHQLSIKTSNILHAKIISGSIYIVLSVLLFAVGTVVCNIIANGVTETSKVLNKFFEFLSSLAKVPDHIANVNAFIFWLAIIIIFVFGLLSTQIFYQMIVTLGASNPLKRLGKAGMVVSFLVLYIGTQVLSVVSTMYIPIAFQVKMLANNMGEVHIIKESFFNIIKSSNAFEFALPLGAFIFSLILTIFGYIYIVRDLNKKKCVS